MLITFHSTPEKNLEISSCAKKLGFRQELRAGKELGAVQDKGFPSTSTVLPCMVEAHTPSYVSVKLKRS